MQRSRKRGHVRDDIATPTLTLSFALGCLMRFKTPVKLCITALLYSSLIRVIIRVYFYCQTGFGLSESD